MKIKILVWILLAAINTSAIAAEKIFTFKPQHRPASELAEALSPLLTETAIIKSYNGSLIIRADDEEINNLETLLKDLDIATKQLIISLTQTNKQFLSDDISHSCGDINYKNKNVKIGCANNVPVATVIGRTHRKRDNILQQIQVIDGGIAFINAGTEIPIGSQVLEDGFVANTITYKKISTGFYVKPQIISDKVHLAISASRQALARTNGGVVESHGANTVVVVPIDTWFNLGGSSSKRYARNREQVYQTQERGFERQQLWLKIQVQQP